MKRNMTGRRVLSLVLGILILIASLSVAGVSSVQIADNSQQIEYTGGWNPQNYSASGTLYKDRIAVRKTVAPTETENYFDITLDIVAKPRVIDRSAAVVVVMDVSNTMNSTHEGLGPNNAGYDINNSRLAHAKAAIGSFLDMYSVDNKLSEDRGFGLVTFNSYANTVIPLTQVNTAEKAEELKKTVNAVTASTDNRERFTNTEGGLQLAYNLLKKSDAAFKYVIFITDGFPTTYIESGRESATQIVGYDTYMKGSYDAAHAGTEGYFADSVTQKLCSQGVNYSDKAADRADDVAEIIKDAGINIFTVGVDIDVQSVPDYLDLAKNTEYTTVDRNGEEIVIGNTTESYKEWLKSTIAGGPGIDGAESTKGLQRYSSGNSLTEMSTAFSNILKGMEAIPAEMMEEAYTLDSLSEYVEFIYFYDLQGKPVDRLTNTRHGGDVAVFDEETATIRWWLTTTQNYYIDNIGNYVLSVSYRVRLKNEAEGFDVQTALATGNKTTFYFKTTDFETGKPLYGDNSIDFPVPQIEGYKGKLVFTDVDALTGRPLEGAEFILRHYGASCNICHGDAQIADKAEESNRRGIVRFEDIPSGHEYVLIETKAPEGYQHSAHHSVYVDYGNTYLDSTLVTEEKPGVVANDTIAPVEIQLVAKKTMTGRDIADGEFAFSLEGVFEYGNKFHEIAPCSADGYAVFHEIRFDQVGTYNFRMYEENLGDSTVIYDTRVYNITIEVSLSEDGRSYIISTFTDGEETENDTKPSPFEFTGKLRKEGQASLRAEVLLDGIQPADNTYRCTLKDSVGNPIDTSYVVNSTADFGKLSYNKEGIYRYSIIEEHEDDLFDTIFFDHSVYNVVVTVTAPEDSDSFETTVRYLIDGEKAEVPLFRNETRQEATLKLNFHKLFDGACPEDNSFIFLLSDSEDNVIEEVRNTDEGIVSFSELVFEKNGHYVYYVKEKQETQTGVKYDDTVYKVYVTAEPHHNLSNYFLEVDIKRLTDGAEELALHAHGINLEIDSEDLMFENITKEEVVPSETAVPDTTVNESATTAPEPDTESTWVTQPVTKPAGLDAPDTGVRDVLVWWIGVLFVVGSSVVICYRRRKTEE